MATIASFSQMKPLSTPSLIIPFSSLYSLASCFWEDGGITVEVITDEIEMSSQEVTKYESVVEEIVWAGGDEGQFEYEDEDVVNGKEILIVMQLVLK